MYTLNNGYEVECNYSGMCFFHLANAMSASSIPSYIHYIYLKAMYTNSFTGINASFLNTDLYYVFPHLKHKLF